MRNLMISLFVALMCIAGPALAAEPTDAAQNSIAASTVTTVAGPAMTDANPERLMSMPENPNKKCGFDSDCSHGKCKSGKCGGCGFDSDCKGWGKCKSGQCGGCNFDSECKGFGKCKSGSCEKSPY